MPILDIVETPFAAVIQQCADCGAVSSLPTAKLVLGHAEGELASDPNIIVLPKCSGCGAIECLNQTFDTIPDELAHHRKKVNALAVNLKDSGRIHPSLTDVVKADKRVPQQVGSLLGPVPTISGMPALPPGANVRKVPSVVRIADVAQTLSPKVEAAGRRPVGKIDPARAALREARRAGKGQAPVPVPVPAETPAPAQPAAEAPAAPVKVQAEAVSVGGKGKGKGKGA